MDKELLFKPRLAERDVDLDGVGTVRIRALTRDEVTKTREAHMDGLDVDTLDVESYEDELISLSLVDPMLTPEEVRRWSQAAPAGEMVRMIDEIKDLSALDEEAAKSRVRASRRERRAAVRHGSGRKAR